MPDSKQNPDQEKKLFQLSARIDVPKSNEADRSDTAERPKDVHEAANAGLNAQKAVEDARTNRHSGSAGGDQFGSIEIDFGNGQKSSRLETATENQMAARSAGLEFLEEQKLGPGEMQKRLAAVVHGRNLLIDSSYLRPDFDQEKVKEIASGIRSDDVGSALALYMLGPEQFAQLGAAHSKEFGDKFLVFGLAPVFGACEQASDKWENEKAELGVKGCINFYVGTCIGAILERAHPLIGLGALGLGTEVAVNEMYFTPEAQERNRKLNVISDRMQSVSAENLIDYSQHTKKTLGPVIFEGAFDIATGGIGLPTGSVAKAGIQEEIAVSGIGLKAVRALDNLTAESWAGICKIFGPRNTHELALAGGGKLPSSEAKSEVFERFYNMMVGKPSSKHEADQIEYSNTKFPFLKERKFDLGVGDMNSGDTEKQVVKQLNPLSCVAAAAEMITMYPPRILRKQEELVALLTGQIDSQMAGKFNKFSLLALKNELGDRYVLDRVEQVAVAKWTETEAIEFNAKSIDKFAVGKVDWIAQVVDDAGPHEVVVHKVCGYDAEQHVILQIKDPWDATYFKMSSKDFGHYFSGSVLMYKD